MTQRKLTLAFNLENIPLEIFGEIFSLLSFRDLAALTLTEHYFNEMTFLCDMIMSKRKVTILREHALSFDPSQNDSLIDKAFLLVGLKKPSLFSVWFEAIKQGGKYLTTAECNQLLSIINKIGQHYSLASENDTQLANNLFQLMPSHHLTSVGIHSIRRNNIRNGSFLTLRNIERIIKVAENAEKQLENVTSTTIVFDHRPPSCGISHAIEDLGGSGIYSNNVGNLLSQQSLNAIIDFPDAYVAAHFIMALKHGFFPPAILMSMIDFSNHIDVINKCDVASVATYSNTLLKQIDSKRMVSNCWGEVSALANLLMHISANLELIKNARILHQGFNSQHSTFFAFPKEMLGEICSHSINYDLQTVITKEETLAIFNRNFNKPT